MNTNQAVTEKDLSKLKTITMVVYALQAVSFILGITFIIAIIVNYVNRSSVANTWLESHFKWQIKTFWIGLVMLLIGIFTLFIVVGYIILLVNVIWVIYRIVKGWSLLVKNQPIS